MRTLNILLLGIIACLPAYTQPQLHTTGLACVSGQVWRRDCNTCRCINNRPACTKRLCRNSRGRRNTNVVSASNEKSCFPTTDPSRWRVDCNWCSCSESGVGRCTLRGCLPGSDAVALLPECEGNAQWRNSENLWCTCSDRRASCSEKRSVDGQCKEGTSWMKDCNTCKCANQKEVCTKRLCRPTGRSLSNGCTPGSQWKQNCNTCTCTSTGVAACTLRACAPTRLAGRSRQRSLSGGDSEEADCKHTFIPSRWRVDCNWCLCTPTGVAACDLRACVPGRAIDLPECEGDAEWRQDNKWCKCEDGKAKCSALSEAIRKPTDLATLEQDFECTEGSSWTEQCNRCRCRQNLKSCTEKLCNPSEIFFPVECEPLSQWRNGCNICQCTEKRVGVCTQRACVSDLPKSKQINEQNREKVCKHTLEPSRWRVDCNWCSCGTAGVARCTLRGCLPGVTLDLPECEGSAEWKNGNQWCTCIEGEASCIDGNIS